MKVLEAEVRAAESCGAKVILVFPGTALPDVRYEVLIERAAKWLKMAVEVVEEYGIEIGVENVWNRYLAGPLEFKKLLETVRDELVGIYLDLGNTLPHSLPEHWIYMLKDFLKEIHIKDFNMSRFEFGIPLYGDVNWARVKKALEGVGYDRYLTIEVPPYKGDPYKAIFDSHDALRRIFGGSLVGEDKARNSWSGLDGQLSSAINNNAGCRAYCCSRYR